MAEGNDLKPQVAGVADAGFHTTAAGEPASPSPAEKPALDLEPIAPETNMTSHSEEVQVQSWSWNQNK